MRNKISASFVVALLLALTFMSEVWGRATELGTVSGNYTRETEGESATLEVCLFQ